MIYSITAIAIKTITTDIMTNLTGGAFSDTVSVTSGISVTSVGPDNPVVAVSTLILFIPVIANVENDSVVASKNVYVSSLPVTIVSKE